VGGVDVRRRFEVRRFERQSHPRELDSREGQPDVPGHGQVRAARIRDRPGPGPRLEDVGAGRATRAEVEGRDASAEPLATWQEIALMHASGRFDFQSHGLDHRSIFTASRLEGFVDPALLRRAQRNDLTFEDYDPARDLAYLTPPLGTPLHPRAPRLSDARRCFPDEAARRACVEHVAAHGGTAFFERRGWHGELRAVYRSSRAARAAERFEDASEQRAALHHDLEQARRMIEARLPGKSVRSLALPWGRGGALALEAAKATGYRAVYWERGRDGPRNVIGGDPYRLGRLGEDFARLLGTRGLRALPALLRDKLRKNLAAGHPPLRAR
jgi:hypothetical protein